jgi:hypothetical protein
LSKCDSVPTWSTPDIEKTRSLLQSQFLEEKLDFLARSLGEVVAKVRLA